MQHDRYDTDILKQLTRIANSLEKIEKKISSEPSSLGELLKDKGLADLIPWVEVKKVDINDKANEVANMLVTKHGYSPNSVIVKDIVKTITEDQ